MTLMSELLYVQNLVTGRMSSGVSPRKDVHSLIANNCQVLRSTIEAYPGLKWIIVGGSPCQDLTFAGPYKGLLGLAGPCSRLFFVFLCIIFTVQQLCGPQAVRFLAENAASMLEMHYRAFCRLLNIDLTPSDKYLWNPSDFGYQITRRRNFFRNFDDVESIPSTTLVFGTQFGPLLGNDPSCPITSYQGRASQWSHTGILDTILSHTHLFGTMIFGMARLTLPKKWLLEPRTFRNVNGKQLFPLLSLNNGRPSWSYWAVITFRGVTWMPRSCH